MSVFTIEDSLDFDFESQSKSWTTSFCSYGENKMGVLNHKIAKWILGRTVAGVDF